MTARPLNDSPTASTCLVLCLKAPGRSKRRLAKEIGELATEAALRMAQCALEDLAQWPGPVCFAPKEPSDAGWLTPWLHGGGDPVILQKGGNLGERIGHVDRALRRTGVTRRIFVGTDCPALDLGYLCEAATALQSHDVVLGPAQDGGVVLMGAKVAWPDLSDLPWSSATLFSALKTRCEKLERAVAVLEHRMDVDTLADLAAAARLLSHDERPARRALAGWLSEQAFALGFAE